MLNVVRPRPDRLVMRCRSGQDMRKEIEDLQHRQVFQLRVLLRPLR